MKHEGRYITEEEFIKMGIPKKENNETDEEYLKRIDELTDKIWLDIEELMKKGLKK